jgi:hypothetical protein
MQEQGGDYWLSIGEEHLPLRGRDFPLLAQGELLGAFISWDGSRAQLLSVCSPQWGIISC